MTLKKIVTRYIQCVDENSNVLVSLVDIFGVLIIIKLVCALYAKVVFAHMIASKSTVLYCMVKLFYLGFLILSKQIFDSTTQNQIDRHCGFELLCGLSRSSARDLWIPTMTWEKKRKAPLFKKRGEKEREKELKTLYGFLFLS
jgi:hypothetical protein